MSFEAFVILIPGVKGFSFKIKLFEAKILLKKE